MKFGISTFMLLLFIPTGKAQQCPQFSAYFTIDSATKMTEHAGHFGSGSSVRYEIFFTTSKRCLKYFDSAWAHDGTTMVILRTPKPAGSEKFHFKKRQRYNLILSISYNNDPETRNSNVVKKPVDCPQELLLRYKAKRKICYMAISKFTNLQTVNLP